MAPAVPVVLRVMVPAVLITLRVMVVITRSLMSTLPGHDPRDQERRDSPAHAKPERQPALLLRHASPLAAGAEILAAQETFDLEGARGGDESPLALWERVRVG